jgi:hypothetical protein
MSAVRAGFSIPDPTAADDVSGAIDDVSVVLLAGSAGTADGLLIVDAAGA